MEEKIVKTIKYINETLERYCCYDCVIADEKEGGLAGINLCWVDFLEKIKELLE